MPTIGSVDAGRTRQQELAQAFREAVALAHENGTRVPVWRGLENKPLHPNVEDADYQCPNQWCVRFWAMVREAEDAADAAAPSSKKVAS